jgi:hypothetical protein
MKAVKITKSMLKSPETLLEKIGAVYEDLAFPSYVYMNEKDHSELEKNLLRVFKKKFPWKDKKQIKGMVETILLNLAPVSLKKGIQKGYVLVDEKAINEEIEKAKNNEFSNSRS